MFAVHNEILIWWPTGSPPKRLTLLHYSSFDHLAKPSLGEARQYLEDKHVEWLPPPRGLNAATSWMDGKQEAWVSIPLIPQCARQPNWLRVFAYFLLQKYQVWMWSYDVKWPLNCETESIDFDLSLIIVSAGPPGGQTNRTNKRQNLWSEHKWKRLHLILHSWFLVCDLWTTGQFSWRIIERDSTSKNIWNQQQSKGFLKWLSGALSLKIYASKTVL